MADTRRRLSVLLLCDDSQGHAENLREHVRGLVRLSRHNVQKYNPVGTNRVRLLNLEQFDVLVVHYSLFVGSERYLPRPLRESIERFRGLKVQFVQDEYRWVDDVTAAIRGLGIDVLFTCVPEQVIPEIYGARLPDVQVIPTLAGFVPDGLGGVSVPPLSERPIDIGYRGRVVPYWLGRLGHEKVLIGKGVVERAAAHGLSTDIAWGEGDRIYGADWYRFTTTCKTTLGTESGSSIVDYDGDLQRRVDEYLRMNPGAGFEEVHREILAQAEGNTVINVVSPRVFEAAALRTALILFPGEYSGVVRPWEHYIPLEKDFSNFEEVASMIRDARALEPLVERTYSHVVASGEFSLRRFVEGFDSLLEKRADPVRSAKGIPVRYATAEVRLRSTSRAVLTPPATLAGGVLRACLLLRSHALRALFLEFLSIRSKDVGPTTRDVLSDLWKLEMLRASPRQGRDGTHASFDDDVGQLIIGPGLVTNGSSMSAGDVRGAVRDGRVCEILWESGPEAPRQHLHALEALALSAPEKTAGALEAALSGRELSTRGA